jgi:hypothetical protein
MRKRKTKRMRRTRKEKRRRNTRRERRARNLRRTRRAQTATTKGTRRRARRKNAAVKDLPAVALPPGPVPPVPPVPAVAVRHPVLAASKSREERILLERLQVFSPPVQNQSKL